ncbi:MAG: hypothetical protein JXR75_09455 [Rhodobacteraceae bacterium]|nr:hypothetical protein [Paracoccaceae bacterium]
MPSFLSRLFGKSAPEAPKTAEPVTHNGFRIFPQPMTDGAQFRIAARVEKDVDGVTKTHQLIRADTRATLDEATEVSIFKAKQAIDQLGDSLFG